MTLAKRTADGPLLWASPKSAVYDLGEAMDALYGANAWTIATDAQPAAVMALQALRARYGRGILRLTGAEAFRFNSGLPAADCAGHFIEGYGELASQVHLNFGSGAFYSSKGNGDYTGGGLRNVGFSLLPGFGASTVMIVDAGGTSSRQGDECEYQNIYASAQGDSYYYRGGSFDGTARTDPQGLRVLNIRNWQQFRCHNLGFLFWNVVQGSIDNLGTYSGSGTGNNVAIGGGGSAPTNTAALGMTNLVCSGELNLTNATDVRIQGKAGSISVGSSFDEYDVALNCGTVVGAPGPNGRWVIY